MTLLDTCILIDVLRGREPAVAFVNSLPDRPALSVITATELIAGVRTTAERRDVDRLLETYLVVGIDLEIARLAGEYVHRYGRSHSVDPIDALIAAAAKVSGADLATLNVKHFPMFDGLVPPYRI
jgi:predicted nucleic acid-binding protein